jgi:hypothetical protein
MKDSYLNRYHVFKRAQFETLLNKNKRLFKDLEKLRAKGLLNDDDFVFTLDDVIKISEGVAMGFWNNCAIQQNPETAWSKGVRGRSIRAYIRDAFVVNENNNDETKATNREG